MAAGCGGGEDKSDAELAREVQAKMESQGLPAPELDRVLESDLAGDCAENDTQERFLVGMLLDNSAEDATNQLMLHMVAMHTYCGDGAVDRYLEALADVAPEVRLALDDEAILEDFDDLS